VQKRALAKEDRDAARNRLESFVGVEEPAHYDIVREAVTEDLDMKRQDGSFTTTAL
jgi:3-hydroxyacyl-CoA dehydrogenase